MLATPPIVAGTAGGQFHGIDQRRPAGGRRGGRASPAAAQRARPIRQGPLVREPERAALGFSNERSLTYWASTLSCGGACSASAAPAGGPPLVDAMKLSSGGPRHDRRCG